MSNYKIIIRETDIEANEEKLNSLYFAEIIVTEDHYDGYIEHTNKDLIELANYYYSGNKPRGRSHVKLDLTSVPKFVYFNLCNPLRTLMNVKYSVDEGLVYFFENVRNYERGVVTRLKPGKFLRKIFPFFNDKQIEILVNRFKDEFTEVENTLVINEDFRHGYLWNNYNNTNRDVRTYKPLPLSCMRYDFGITESNDWHPCDVYGSGDFVIAKLVDVENKILARAVIYKGNKTYAPIYTVVDIYGDKLKSSLEKLGYEEDEGESWIGAKLKKIHIYDNNYVSTYLDNFQEVHTSDDMEYFEIGYSESETSTTWNDTTGKVYFVEKDTVSCYECGQEHDVDGGDFVTVDYETYCTCCANFCEYEQEYTTEPLTFVKVGNNSFEQWADSAVERFAYYVRDVSEYYSESYFSEENIQEYNGEFYTCGHLIENLCLVFNEDTQEWEEPKEDETEE